MTMTWRARCHKGHYLPTGDIPYSLEPESWDDTCRHQAVATVVPSEDDFGHEPMDVITNGELRGTVCVRCAVWSPDFHYVAWPCMSALVLGLAPREAS
jgi:hypothetical protein